MGYCNQASVSGYNYQMVAFFPDIDAERLPPEAVRLLEMTAELLPDRRRIRTHLSLTPFIQPPLIEITMADPNGDACGEASIVEPASWNLDLTLHLRTPDPKTGLYSLTAVVSYPELGEVDQRTIEFDNPSEWKS